MTLEVALCGLALLAWVSAVAVAVLSRQRGAQAPADRLLVDRLRERFVITLTTGETFDGLLDDVDDRTLVLLDVKVVGDDGRVRAVDGHLVLERDRIAYMQRP